MTNMRYTVSESDTEAVKGIVQSTGFFSKSEVDMAGELVQAYLSQGEVSGYHFIFIDEGSRPVAYACFGEIPCTERRFDLYWIAVDSGKQGKGYGKMLLERVEEEVARHGGQKIFIETSSREQYHPTRQFYKNRGYRIEAQLRDFYSWGDHKVILSKTMPGARPAVESSSRRLRPSKIRKIWVQAQMEGKPR